MQYLRIPKYNDVRKGSRMNILWKVNILSTKYKANCLQVVQLF